MSMTIIEEKIQEPTTAGSTLSHYFCPNCYPNAEKSFCGINFDDDDEGLIEVEVDCFVCLGLDYCPECDQ